MTLEIKTLNEIELETKRFLKKLVEAKKRITEDEPILLTGCKETGAVRRAAIDLKNELTKLNN